MGVFRAEVLGSIPTVTTKLAKQPLNIIDTERLCPILQIIDAMIASGRIQAPSSA